MKDIVKQWKLEVYKINNFKCNRFLKKRKKADGLVSKSALVVLMNKLVRIIYSQCNNGCLFKLQFALYNF